MAKDKIKNQTIAQAGDLRALLLQYRENAGISLEQMASALCLSEEVIKNLENEEFQLLAEPPYVRGYIRNYAKQADVDSSEAIRVYETLRGANPDALDYHIKATPSVHQSRKGLSPIFLQLALLTLLLASLIGLFMIPAVNQWFHSVVEGFSEQANQNPKNIDDKPSLLGSMPVPIPLNPQESPTPSEPRQVNENTVKSAPDGKEKPKNADEKGAKAAKEQVAEQNPKEEAENQKTGEAPPPDEANANKIHIKLVFTKEVWMRIRNKKNKTVYEGQTNPGQERELDLEKPLTFRVGNAQGLSLFVNGKPVDISQYIKGSIANFTLK